MVGSGDSADPWPLVAHTLLPCFCASSAGVAALLRAPRPVAPRVLGAVVSVGCCHAVLAMWALATALHPDAVLVTDGPSLVTLALECVTCPKLLLTAVWLLRLAGAVSWQVLPHTT